MHVTVTRMACIIGAALTVFESLLSHDYKFRSADNEITLHVSMMTFIACIMLVFELHGKICRNPQHEQHKKKSDAQAKGSDRPSLRRRVKSH